MGGDEGEGEVGEVKESRGAEEKKQLSTVNCQLTTDYWGDYIHNN
ncbi:hypothetical protein NSMS1_12250 [Nostoc sp. MS1]|nr:hypothetical protein NSMS1_12250 [Nostoc sp. MS1]